MAQWLELLRGSVAEYPTDSGMAICLVRSVQMPTGPVAVRYPDPIAAARCVDVMDGRGFSGRTLKVDSSE